MATALLWRVRAHRVKRGRGRGASSYSSVASIATMDICGTVYDGTNYLLDSSSYSPVQLDRDRNAAVMSC